MEGAMGQVRNEHGWCS